MRAEEKSVLLDYLSHTLNVRLYLFLMDAYVVLEKDFKLYLQC